MHLIVTEKPGYAEIAAQKEKHEAATRKFQERNRKAEADFKAAQEKYKAAVRAATLEGEEPPAAPIPPQPLGDPMILRDRKQQLRDAERKYLADNAEVLLDQLAARLEDVMDNEAKPYVEQLRLIAVEVRELLVSVSEIRRLAGDRTGTVSHADFGATELVSAVVTGAALLAPPSRGPRLVVHGMFR
jgi:hypothetical protein